MNTLFEYNTQKKNLLLPEYGRNVLLLVEHLKQIQNKQERNEFAFRLIDLMGAMNPHLRDIENFKHILWDHLAIMTDFNLDIDWQYPLPTPEIIYQKPSKLPYNQNKIGFRYYGKTIELMIQEASKMEDSRERDVLIKTIGNHMKKQYLMWNKEVVEDSTILNDIEFITNGRIKLSPNLKLTDSRDIKTNSSVNANMNTNGNKKKNRR